MLAVILRDAKNLSERDLSHSFKMTADVATTRNMRNIEDFFTKICLFFIF